MKIEASVLAAIITASVTMLGWIAVSYLNARQADKTRRLELRMRHSERQIEEFYGPAMILIQTIWNVWRIREELILNIKESDNEKDIVEIKNSIYQFIYENYFSKIHSELNEIIKTKAYLIDEAILPDSLREYLEHSVMQEIQNRLLYQARVSTASVEGTKWPRQFPNDIENRFDAAMRTYQELIQEMGRSAKPRPTKVTPAPSPRSAP